ncbi:hypothetical protein QF042_000073 [Pedobacter sp. W3I1]|uniref:hypothetical protein n=1 Tax=Pedobacter sp. W3I1 TaxID=3042291 RepID=UPI002782BDE7|nr:hypothetical protein [Pedobacter sp. W3I1]MDQ0636508.1 hypothetical protein [Pedobacter sp. W3I1]
MKRANISVIVLVLSLFICCTPESGNGQKVSAINTTEVKKTTVESKVIPDRLDDEKEFRKLFKTLNENLKKKNINGLAALMNFPFYTSHAELDNGMGAASDPISKTEFKNYKNLIFNHDVLRLLPHCREDNLSEIDEKTTEIYYKTLKKLTDPGSKMYEVYMQYPESNTQAESFFGFVFGRVNSQFKTIATYAKWPVK